MYLGVVEHVHVLGMQLYCFLSNLQMVPCCEPAGHLLPEN